MAHQALSSEYNFMIKSICEHLMFISLIYSALVNMKILIITSIYSQCSKISEF